MTDNANPQGGATGEVTIPPEGLDSFSAASLLEQALDREDTALQEQARDEQGRYAKRPDEPEAQASDDGDDESPDDAEEASDEEGTDAAEETVEADEEAASFSSVNELAEALDMPLDDFLGTIKVPVKVDGKEQWVTLSEARDGFQMQSAFTKKSMELAEQRKAFDAERTAKAEALEAALQQAQSLTQAMEQNLVSDYQKINWDELRLTDPAEFAAKRQEFAERVQQVEWMKSQAGYETAKQQEAKQAEQQKALQAHLEKEAQMLMDALPEWSDPDKAKVERSELRDYLTGQLGYSDDEVGQLFDHRLVVAFRKAMLFDKGVKAQNVAKKKVAKLPKLVKKGAKPNPKESARRDKDKKLAALQKTGKVDEAAAVFFDML